MKAYSQDLRERVLRAVDQGYPRAEIVQLLGISLSTLKRYLKQRREEGHVRPKAIPGRPPKKRAQVEAGMLSQLQVHDDATLEQHCNLDSVSFAKGRAKGTRLNKLNRRGRGLWENGIIPFAVKRVSEQVQGRQFLISDFCSRRIGSAVLQRRDR